MTSAVNMDQAQTEYGVTANLINAIPELQSILAQAATDGWSQDKLNATVAQSPWYQQHGQSLRNLIMQQATDPGTYNENLQNAADLVSQTAQQMGRQVDPWQTAYQYLAQGWTAADLKAHIGANGTGIGNATDGYVGDVAQYESHLKQIAESYGVPYTQQFIDGYVNNIQAGKDTADGFTNVMQARAKAAYPQFAEQIDAGQTMTQIADPYMATYAKTLEVPQTQVNLSDPLIKQALSATDPKTGAMQNVPLWKFEQTLKADPRYDQTDQAKTDAYSTLHQIGKDFGFAS